MFYLSSLYLLHHLMTQTHASTSDYHSVARDVHHDELLHKIKPPVQKDVLLPVLFPLIIGSLVHLLI